MIISLKLCEIFQVSLHRPSNGPGTISIHEPNLCFMLYIKITSYMLKTSHKVVNSAYCLRKSTTICFASPGWPFYGHTIIYMYIF